MGSPMTVSPAASADGERRFERFYTDHEADVRRVVRRYLWGPVVDDVVQETFAQAYRSELHLAADPVRTAKTLWGIARNRSIDVLRRRMRGGEEVREDGRLVSLPASQDVEPEVMLLATRRREGISEALGSLCDRQRRILFMHYVDGRRYEEIAAEEGITVDAVKATLARGRRSFRHLYAAIADREGLAVVVGALLGRLRLRFQAAKARAAAGVESLAGGITAASPVMANAFVAVVVAGSLSLAAGSTAAAAQGGPPEHASSEVPAEQASGEEDDAEDDAPPEEASGRDEHQGGGAPASEPGPSENAAPPAAEERERGEGAQGAPAAAPTPGRQRAEAEAGTGDVSPTPWSNAGGNARAEAEVDPEEGRADNTVDAMSEATVDMVDATQEASSDVSFECEPGAAPPTGDPTQDRPSQYVCPVLAG